MQEDYQELNGLIQKYLAGTASLGEREIVENWYRSVHEEAEIEVPIDSEQEVGETEERILRQIRRRMTNSELTARVHKIPRLKRIQWWSAAAAVLLLTLSTWLWMRPSRHIQAPAAYIRNITLPDGSTVILQANGKLEYPFAFRGNTREVTLTGEAYFDITAKNDCPFIIHSGKIRTTVLGTAFNIRAYAGQTEIVVYVTKGKVRVEDEKKVLGELTSNQQMIYTVAKEEGVRQMVQAEKLVTDWAGHDMVFQRVPFSSVASALEKRFGVTIEFANPVIRNCLVRSSFDGTETLEKVLQGLAKVQDITYTIEENKTVVINGEGCQ